MKKLSLSLLALLSLSSPAWAQATISVTNEAGTGTTLNKLAKLTGAPSTAIIAATSDTSGIVGIVLSGAGTTGSALIAKLGTPNCVFDATSVVAGDYVQISSVTAGACHDAGATAPTSGQVIGRALASGAGGSTIAVDINPGIVPASSGSGTGANPTATAGPTAVNGSASTFMRSDGAPAVQKGTNAQFGIIEGDGSTITCVAGVCTAIGGSATSIVPGTTTIGGATAPCLIENSTSTTMACPGVGTGVITALGVNTGSTGAFVVQNGAGGTPSSLTLTSATGLPISTGVSGLGTGVATAAAANLSANGGIYKTVFSGAKALATGAISSAACTSAQTDTATGTATTDVVLASFNGDPTAVTGYVPLTTGMLTIIAYPTADTVNFKVCNNTSSSITPGAITLNWRVVR